MRHANDDTRYDMMISLCSPEPDRARAWSNRAAQAQGRRQAQAQAQGIWGAARCCASVRACSVECAAACYAWCTYVAVRRIVVVAGMGMGISYGAARGAVLGLALALIIRAKSAGCGGGAARCSLAHTTAHRYPSSAHALCFLFAGSPRDCAKHVPLLYLV